MPVAERLTEAEHSKVNRYCAKRRVAGQTISLVLRQPEVETLLADNRWQELCLQNYNMRCRRGSASGRCLGSVVTQSGSSGGVPDERGFLISK